MVKFRIYHDRAPEWLDRVIRQEFEELIVKSPVLMKK